MPEADTEQEKETNQTQNKQQQLKATRMFQLILKEKFEYFTRYFENAFQNRRKFPQSIILYGQDSIAQYYLAQDIARVLNCMQDGKPDCTCLNCNWIRQNQHPAVLTISKNDNKPSDDNSKKVISIKQVQLINSSLVNTSEYYRVFIICDSEIKELTGFEREHIENFSTANFKLPAESNSESWYPHPLTRDVLQSEAANALLKSVEEPPANVLFVFLTKDKDDLLETIVSRSQSFYIPAHCQSMAEKYDTAFFTDSLHDYPNIKKSQVLGIAQSFIEAKDSLGYEFEYIFDCMQYYFMELMKNNIENKPLVSKLQKDIQSLQYAKKQANAYIKPQAIIEDFLFSISN